MTEADTWAGVEGKEYEGVGDETFDTVVEEAVGVKRFSYRWRQVVCWSE